MWARIQLDLLGGWYGLLVGMTTALGTACVLWIGVSHVRARTLTLGSLFARSQLPGPAVCTAKNHWPQSDLAAIALVGLERAFSVLDQLAGCSRAP